MPQARRPPPTSSSSKTKRQPQQKASSLKESKESRQATQSRRRDDNAGATSQTDPLLLQQFKSILNLFQSTFSHLFTPALPTIIQDVKQSLYLRDYAAAFSSLEKLQAYAVRWSVARALAYYEMISEGWWSRDVTRGFRYSRRVNITCIGGGAGAELAAIAAASAFFRTVQAECDIEETTTDKEEKPEDAATEDSASGVHLTLLDFATWAPITNSLYETITNPKAGQQLHLDPTAFTVNCQQQDVLSPLSETTIGALGSADIITLLFTAGELYSQSPTAATKFLVSLHTLTKPGATLVVVDSAGGFEELEVTKKGDVASSSANPSGFKLGFLLDKTLTNKERWEIVASEDAQWWRVPQELRDGSDYPVALENMRCLIRVYRRAED